MCSARWILSYIEEKIKIIEKNKKKIKKNHKGYTNNNSNRLQAVTYQCLDGVI